MFCPGCGKQMSDEDSFCSVCGRGLKTTTVGTAAVSPSPKARVRFPRWPVFLFACLPILVGIGLYQIDKVRPSSDGPPRQAAPPKLSPQQEGELIGAAKAQIGKKAYLAARSTLDSVLHAAAATSPQAVEAASLLKKISPLAAKQAQQEQEVEQLQRELRNGARATLEDSLLSAGYDVQVGFVGKEGGDNRNLLIVGEPVNRVFIHNLIGPGPQRSLQRDGFTKITFMKSRWDWVGEYDVVTNTITASQ